MTIQPFPTRPVTRLRPLGAVQVDAGQDINALFAAVAKALKSKGRRLSGYLQCERLRAGRCCPEILLTSLSDDSELIISQDLGRGAGGCVVNPGALLEVSASLDVLLDGETGYRPELLVVNRFGRCESEGAGLRSAIEKACASHIPALVAIRPKYLDHWRRFAADYAEPLANDCSAVIAWCEQAMRYGFDLDAR